MSANNEEMWRHGEVNAGSCALRRGYLVKLNTQHEQVVIVGRMRE
jgi:hypothetical protein